jgi:hypothetical protein
MPGFGQVLPGWVKRTNQRDLLGARPFLNLFLTVDGIVHVFGSFVINQPINFVAFSETFDDAFFVIEDSSQCHCTCPYKNSESGWP